MLHALDMMFYWRNIHLANLSSQMYCIYNRTTYSAACCVWSHRCDHNRRQHYVQMAQLVHLALMPKAGDDCVPHFTLPQPIYVSGFTCYIGFARNLSTQMVLPHSWVVGWSLFGKNPWVPPVGIGEIFRQQYCRDIPEAAGSIIWLRRSCACHEQCLSWRWCPSSAPSWC